MSIEPGTQIGPYEVQEFLGRGAMGVVYKAWHASLARPAAVKVLQAIAPDADATARFRREAQSIAQMRHPNILNVFDFGEVEGVPYMIVEYVPGGSLGDRLKEAGLPRPEAIRILRGVASGLDYAHSQGVVHRDVKPANVLMHGDGTPVLADFGLAKLLEGSSMRSQTGATTGTPAYMAPEQVTGSAVGPAADRYALASVAYELLTGSVPFDTGGVLELLYAQVHREPPPPSSKAPDLPPGVDAVLLRGLAKKPEDRWESCVGMIDALDSAFDRDVAATMPVPKEPFVAPVAAPVAAAGAKPARKPRRWPWFAGGVAAVIIVLLVLGLLRQAGGGSVAISGPTTAIAGEPVSLVVTHLPANTKGDVVLATTPTRIGSFQSDGQGGWSGDVTIPRGTVPGAHTIELCWGIPQQCHGGAPIEVSPRAATPVPTPTPGRVFHPSVTLSTVQPKSGGQLMVVGRDFDPSKQYAIYAKYGTPLTPHQLQPPAAVSPDGTFRATVTLSGVPPGPAFIAACINPTLNTAADCTDDQVQVQR